MLWEGEQVDEKYNDVINVTLTRCNDTLFYWWIFAIELS